MPPPSSPRYIHTRLTEALSDSLVLVIHGPQQSEKPMLARLVGNKDKVEVEIVLESAGSVAGIEIQASSTGNNNDFRRLRKLQNAVHTRFASGWRSMTGRL